MEEELKEIDETLLMLVRTSEKIATQLEEQNALMRQLIQVIINK